MHTAHLLQRLKSHAQHRIVLTILVLALPLLLLLAANCFVLSSTQPMWVFGQFLGMGTIMLAMWASYHLLSRSRQQHAHLTHAQHDAELIFQHIHNGVCLVNAQSTIGEQYSTQLETIINQQHLAGKNLLDLLSTMVLEQEQLVIRGFFKQLFDPNVNDNVLWELNPLSQLDVRIAHANGKRVSRCLDFHFTRIREGQNIVSVLVNIKDITHTLQTQKHRLLHSDLQANLLLEVMHLDSVTLSEFVRFGQHRIEALYETLSQEGHSTNAYKLRLEPLAQDMAQFKHQSNQLNLLALVYLSDEFEQHLQYLQQQHYLNRDDFLPLDITLEQLQQTLQTVIQVHSRLQQAKPQTEQALDAAFDIDALPALNWQRDVQHLAKRHHKTVQLTGNFAAFQHLPLHLSDMVQNWTWHLINNAVVHGIETPSKRPVLNKPEQGQITVSLLDLDKHYRLSVEDDGQGIDFQALQNALPEATSNTALLLQQLFAAEFTTSPTVNSDAGDGMGLYWLKQWVDGQGGSVEVHTQAQQYTRFVVLLPKPAQAVSHSHESMLLQSEPVLAI